MCKDLLSTKDNRSKETEKTNEEKGQKKKSGIQGDRK